MNTELLKPVATSLIRHLVTIGGTALAGYGLVVDPSSTEGLVQLIVGMLFAGSATLAGSIDKVKRVSKPVTAMKGWFLSERSLKNMEGIDEQLVSLINKAIIESPYDFVVIEGLRTKERQRELVNAGKSRTMNSKHLVGKAFDFMAYDSNGNGSWDLKYYTAITDKMKEIVQRENLDITFGIDWKGFVDAGHVQVGI